MLLEPLLNELDTARVLNVAVGTLRNWRSKGKGPPATHVGTAVRYAPERIREYIEVHTRRAAAVKLTRQRGPAELHN
jgi:hypothetical protein